MFEGRKARIARVLQKAEREDRLQAHRRAYLSRAFMLFLTVVFSAVLYRAILEHDVGLFLITSAMLVPCAIFVVEQVRRALRPGPMLSMDRRGIDHANFGRIPWADVVGIRAFEQRTNNVAVQKLTLKIARPHRYYAQLSWAMRLIHLGWRKRQPRYGDLTIGVNGMSVPHEVIVETAQRLRRTVDARFLTAWFDGPADGIDAQLEYYEALAELGRVRTDIASLEAAKARLNAADAGFRRAQAEWMQRQFPHR